MAQRVRNLPAMQETHFKEAVMGKKTPLTSCKLTLNFKISHLCVKHLGDPTQLYFLHSMCLNQEFIETLVRIKKKKKKQGVFFFFSN